MDTIVVTRLPHRLKIAKKPTTNSTMVKTSVMTNAQFIQPAALAYTFMPLSYLSPRIVCTLVLFSCQTASGSKWNLNLRAEQKVIFSSPVLLLTMSPSQ